MLWAMHKNIKQKLFSFTVMAYCCWVHSLAYAGNQFENEKEIFHFYVNNVLLRIQLETNGKPSYLARTSLCSEA